MTLLLVGKIWFLITVVLILLLMLLLYFIYLINLHGTPNFFLLFVEINNKYTFFWPSFTEVTLFRVDKILNIVKIVLKCGFP